MIRYEKGMEFNSRMYNDKIRKFADLGVHCLEDSSDQTESFVCVNAEIVRSLPPTRIQNK